MIKIHWVVVVIISDSGELFQVSWHFYHSLKANLNDDESNQSTDGFDRSIERSIKFDYKLTSKHESATDLWQFDESTKNHRNSHRPAEIQLTDLCGTRIIQILLNPKYNPQKLWNKMRCKRIDLPYWWELWTLLPTVKQALHHCLLQLISIRIDVKRGKPSISTPLSTVQVQCNEWLQ